MKAFRELGRLPREIWVLFLATLINRAGTMVLPFLALYLTSTLSFSAATAGAVLAAFGAGALVASPLAGLLTDRLGARRVMLVSLFGSGAALLAFPLAKTFAEILTMTLLWAVIGELFRPANLALLSGLVTAEYRKPAFALNRLAINLGMSMGPALGGFLATRSFFWLFLVDGFTTLAAGAILFRLKAGKAPPPSLSPEGASREAPGGRAWRDRRLLLFLVALLPVGMVFFQHESSMALYLVGNLSLAPSVYGLLFTINTLLIVCLEVPLNAAMANWSHRATLTLGAFLIGAGFGALGLVHDLPGVIATVVIWTFGEMVLLPGMSAYVAEVASEARRGEYMGLYTMSFNLAFAVGPYTGTLLLSRFGGGVLWGTMFGLGLISVALFSRVRTESQSPGTRSESA